jgi:hypothetical protein
MKRKPKGGRSTTSSQRPEKPVQQTEGFVRPQATVLSAKALIPDANLILPAPNQFTHVLTRPQPYYFTEPEAGAEPDGKFPRGTKVVLLAHPGGPYCRVADGEGRHVVIQCASLKRL